MSSAAAASNFTAALAVPDEFQAVCGLFEKQRSAGESASIEPLVAQWQEPGRADLLRFLLKVELLVCEIRGEKESVNKDRYTQRFPEYATTICEAFAWKEHLDEVLEQLMDRWEESGQDQPGSLGVAELCQEHPELMPIVRRRIAQLQHVNAAIAPTCDSDPRVGSGGFHVRCPHCHSPIEMAPDSLLSNIDCPACSGHFSVASEGSDTREAPTVTKLGHFELIERLGMGAFGTVWKARDLILGRTVALKIPRKGQLDLAQEEKFIREARAVARLSHRNIVPVFEVGRDKDTLFIVTDFIRGVPLSEMLLSERVSLREAAQLTACLARALQHAHDAGIIHRDLKPQNIMIDEQGEPHVMDFGLAKREIGDVTMTIEGAILGTPSYMSPEQARGEGHEARATSDIYSLGVILFQLLTGELPFRGTVRMLIHKAINDEPPSPRRMDLRIPKDLETICLKCLQKEPERRFSSADLLADELERWLRDEPIQTRPISPAARAIRWCRRNPLVASLSSTAVVLLCTVAIVAMSGYVQKREKEQAAKTAARISDFLVDLFDQDPIFSGQDDLKFTSAGAFARPNPDLTARELLTRGSHRVEAELAGEAEIQATLMETIGRAFRGLGEYDEAAAILRRALAIREVRRPVDPLKVAETKYNLASVLHYAGDFQQAEQVYRDVLDTREQLLGRDHLAVSMTMQSLGLLLTSEAEGQTSAEAEELLTEAVEIRRRLMGDDHQSVAIGLAAVAAYYLNCDRQELAQRAIVEALKIFSDHPRGTGPSPQAALSNYLAGHQAQEDGDFETAARHLEKSVQVARQLLGDEHPYVAWAMHDYAAALSAKGDREAAAEVYEEALVIGQKMLPRTHTKILMARKNLARHYLRMGHWQPAERLIRPVIEDVRRVHGADSLELADCLAGLAQIERQAGDYAEAVQTARKALKIAANRSPPEALEFYRREVAMSLLADHKPDQAIAVLRERFGGEPDSEGDAAVPDARPDLETFDLLGRAYLATGNWDAARQVFLCGRETALKEKSGGWAARFRALEAECTARAGDLTAAEEPLRTAHGTLETLYGESGDWTRDAASALHWLYNELGRSEDAARFVPPPAQSETSLPATVERAR